MPLFHGKSKDKFEHNVRVEMQAGKPQKQSLAIAYNVAKSARKKNMAAGGMVPEQDMGRNVGEDLAGVSNDEDSLDEYMAHGGMKHAAHIAQMVMKKMSQGGMAGCYADGGMVDEDDSDMDAALAGDDNFSADEDDHMPNLGYPEGDNESEDGAGIMEDSKDKRRGMLKSIMRGLHREHMGR